MKNVFDNYACEGQMTFDDFLAEIEKSKWDSGEYMNLPEGEPLNIVAYIREGHENAISRKELCKATGLKDRVVRSLIEEARRDTIIISNTDGSGYWIYPDNPTPEEKKLLEKYVKQQESRAKSIFYALYPARQMMNGEKQNGR